MVVSLVSSQSLSEAEKFRHLCIPGTTLVYLGKLAYYLPHNICLLAHLLLTDPKVGDLK